MAHNLVPKAATNHGLKHLTEKEIDVTAKDLTRIVKEGVSRCYWQQEKNCATTALNLLSEIFTINLNSQTLDAALAIHGAGGYGAQCGLVEGPLMFMGIFGRKKGIPDERTIEGCREFAEKFEGRFGSLLCRTLRPQGFSPDDPPHLCEGLTCEAIEFAAMHVAGFLQEESQGR